MGGWIKLHRKTLTSSIFDNANLFKMWIWCLLKASHTGYKQMVGLEEIQLKEGQFVTGRKKGSAELKINPSTFYKHLKLLETYQMIDLKSNNKMTVVTIVNWALYQNDDNKSSSEITTKEQQNNNKITTKEQRNNTNKNVKNVKNEKNEKKNIYAKLDFAELVKITEPEHQKLIDQFGEAGSKERIESLNLYIGSTGKKYKSHYLTILNWDRAEQKKKENQTIKGSAQRNFETQRKTEVTNKDFFTNA